MNEITAITAQKNKKRCNIFIDGEYRCSLDKMAALSFSLKVGDVIDEQKLASIIRDSEEKSSFDSAVKYLCIRMRAESEIVNYLRGKSYAEGIIEKTVSKLKEYGYLSDSEFSKAYISTYRHKYGNKKLRYELGRLGVDISIVDGLLENDEDSELAACEKVAEKYIKTRPKAVTISKLVTFLYSKGFDIEMAKDAAKKYADICEDA